MSDHLMERSEGLAWAKEMGHQRSRESRDKAVTVYEVRMLDKRFVGFRVIIERPWLRCVHERWLLPLTCFLNGHEIAPAVLRCRETA